MQGWTSPYEILGITRAASLEAVRAAYHAAVLRYHPDRRPDEPNARAAFERIVEAYRTILRWRGEEDAAAALGPAPAVSPVQFAVNAQQGTHGGMWEYAQSDTPLGPACRRSWRATRDEPLLFAVIWLLAILAGLGAELALVAWLPKDSADEIDEVAATVLLVAAPLVVYAAVFALAVAVPVMTRKAVYLVMRFTHGLRKALPSPRGADLPQGPKGRLP